MKSLLIIGIFLASVSAVTSCAPSEESTPRASSSPAHAQESRGDGSRYVNGTDLVRPTDYREWPFIGSALGLTYEGETVSPATPPTFTNTFVNPASYRAFMQTGRWPNETIFVLEFRRSQTDAVPNEGGALSRRLVGDRSRGEGFPIS